MATRKQSNVEQANDIGRAHGPLVEIAGVKARVSEAEWQTRLDLAACYRLVFHYGWHHLNLNHISAAVPGEDGHILINPYGPMFNEVTASNIVKIDLDGNVLDDTPYGINPAGYTIHSAIHAARDDVGCVLHTHTEAGLAVSALKCGLLPLNQDAVRFYNRIGYHDYEGISLELGERERLVQSLGKHRALVLRNHGLLTAGRTIAEAFTLMFHLEKACAAQIMINATIADDPRLVMLSPEMCEHSAQQAWRINDNAEIMRWPALVRWMDRVDPGYRV
jgi:ribulose-5-phosphate 4-epimerase/fuculose-1-phosphate aldolase